MKKLSKQARHILIFTFLIMLFSTVALLSSSMALLASDRIFYGVTVEQIALGGLSESQAEEKLRTVYEQKMGKQPFIELRCHNNHYYISNTDINLTIDFAETARNAYLVGRTGNPINKLLERIRTSQSGTQLTYNLTYQSDKLEAVLLAINNEVTHKKENARIELVNNQLQVINEKIGQKINYELLLEDLQQSLASLSVPIHMEIPLSKDIPDITAEDLKDIDTVLASYSSQFNSGNFNRSENIRIAADSISSYLLRPEQLISFNDIVGPRIVEAGFKEAPVIIEGKTVPDIGGGVCQVSSTLYNAILRANMTPIERTPHFHPLGYVPIGLDATVADNLLDFKFKNTLSHAAYVLSEINDGTLTIHILGHASDLDNAEYTVVSHVDKVLEPRIVTNYDSSLPAGKRIVIDSGLRGFIVSSYRIKKINGSEVSREQLYVDEYTPEDKIIAIGK